MPGEAAREQSKTAQKEYEAVAAAKKRALKDKQWEKGAKDTSKAESASTTASNKAAKKAADRAAAAAEGGGGKNTQPVKFDKEALAKRKADRVKKERDAVLAAGAAAQLNELETRLMPLIQKADEKAGADELESARALYQVLALAAPI